MLQDTAPGESVTQVHTPTHKHTCLPQPQGRGNSQADSQRPQVILSCLPLICVELLQQEARVQTLESPALRSNSSSYSF